MIYKILFICNQIKLYNFRIEAKVSSNVNDKFYAFIMISKYILYVFVIG